MLAKTIHSIRRIPIRLCRRICCLFPYFLFDQRTRDTQTPASFDDWYRQHILGVNRGPYWPVHPSSVVVGWKNILAGVETSPGLSPGCYIQGEGEVHIGDYTQIAPNVGIISANHVLGDSRQHERDVVRIGEYCWLGMGAIILPGVMLGDHTIVGAGAVVTKSFPDGYCVIAGNPASKLKDLDQTACEKHRSPHEYHGYIPRADFEVFRKKFLNV